MSDLTLIGLGILALIILLFWKRLKGYIVLSQLKRLQNDVNKLDKLAEKRSTRSDTLSHGNYVSDHIHYRTANQSSKRGELCRADG